MSRQRMDMLDLLIETLLKHERRLDEITERLERILKTLSQDTVIEEAKP